MNKITILTTLCLTIYISYCDADNTERTKNNNNSSSVVAMTNGDFKQKIFNYEKNKVWKFEGNLPVIIDFYASWCGPCRVLSPKVEEIAKQYAGRIVVYKVDTDEEQILARNMGISSLPTLLFIPVKGKPQATMGAVPKESLVKAINEILLVE